MRAAFPARRRPTLLRSSIPRPPSPLPPRFTRPRTQPDAFTVAHYAGAVTYDSHNFLSKNRDFVVAEHEALLAGLGRPFCCRAVRRQAEAVDGDPRFCASAYRFSSVAARFKAQLADLMAALADVEPHYVRCVKPNGRQLPRPL